MSSFFNYSRRATGCLENKDMIQVTLVVILWTLLIRIPWLFSNLEIIFCAFLTKNYFVKVLIQFIWARATAPHISNVSRKKPI